MNTKVEPTYEDVEKSIVGTSGEPTEMVVSNQQLESLSFLNPDEIPDLSDENVTVGYSLAPQYYENFIKEGDTVRAVYNGLTITHSRKNVKAGDPAKEIRTVVFQNKDGVYLHSGANLVTQLEKCRPGTPIQIKYLGREKTGNGNEINKFEVRVLNIIPF